MKGAKRARIRTKWKHEREEIKEEKERKREKKGRVEERRGKTTCGKLEKQK